MPNNPSSSKPADPTSPAHQDSNRQSSPFAQRSAAYNSTHQTTSNQAQQPAARKTQTTSPSQPNSYSPTSYPHYQTTTTQEGKQRQQARAESRPDQPLQATQSVMMGGKSNWQNLANQAKQTQPSRATDRNTATKSAKSFQQTDAHQQADTHQRADAHQQPAFNKNSDLNRYKISSDPTINLTRQRDYPDSKRDTDINSGSDSVSVSTPSRPDSDRSNSKTKNRPVFNTQSNSQNRLNSYPQTTKKGQQEFQNQPELNQFQPNQPQQNQNETDQTEPDQQRPRQATYNQSSPDQAQPNQTNPSQPQPDQAESDQSQSNQGQNDGYRYPEFKQEKSRLAPGMMRPIPEETVLKWQAPSRPFKKRNRQYFSTIAIIAFLISAILAFSGQLVAVSVVVALSFLAYVLSVIPPQTVTIKVSNYGIRIEDNLYYWQELGRFWFTDKDDQVVLNVETIRFPGRITLLLNSADEGSPAKEELKALMSEVLLNEKPKPTTYEKAADWLQKKIPLDFD